MHRLILISAAIAALVPLHAQTYPGVFSSNPAFHVVQEGFGSQIVKGKPFSATEERRSLQVLGDGTRIENTQTNRLYRDNEGRTRVEEMNGAVSIYDPTSGTRVQLDPATRTARKGTGRNSVFVGDNRVVTFFNNGVLGANELNGFANGYSFTTRPNSAEMQGVMAETTENLPTQAVNGAMAQGIRTTMTIPKGQIGNNRDIKVVTERWFSNDLQMLVKSVNNDPRFGDTTYQLTKIAQSEPDAALFQIPSDYTVVEAAAPPALKRPAAARQGAPAAPGPKAAPRIQ